MKFEFDSIDEVLQFARIVQAGKETTRVQQREERLVALADKANYAFQTFTNKIDAIKWLRQEAGIPLKDAKDLIDAAQEQRI